MGTHKNSSKERWLREAKKIVIKKGVEGINIDTLSEKLEVAKTSFYHFYGSKSRFLVELIQKGFDEGSDSIIRYYRSLGKAENRIKMFMKFIIEKNIDNELFLRRLRSYGLKSKKRPNSSIIWKKDESVFLKT